MKKLILSFLIILLNCNLCFSSFSEDIDEDIDSDVRMERCLKRYKRDKITSTQVIDRFYYITDNAYLKNKRKTKDNRISKIAIPITIGIIGIIQCSPYGIGTGVYFLIKGLSNLIKHHEN